MALPTIAEALANLSAVGMQKESVFGTVAAATNFLPDTDCNIESDPGLFYAKVMQGIRDEQIWGLYGEYKHSGPVSGPLFPVNGIPLFFGSIGQDGGQGIATGVILGNGVTGTGSTSPTTLNGALTAGTSTVIVTSAAGYATSNIIQIDVNSAGVTSAECRKITGIASNTLTVDVPINFNHLSGAAVKIVTAPYTHTAVPTNLLPSYTIEKNIGGRDSIQFAGSRVSKFDLKADAASSEASFTADMMSVSSVVLPTPTAISVDTATPYVFSEYTMTLLGQSVTQANKFAWSIDNGIKATYTMAAMKGPSFLTPTTRKVSGQITVVFTSLDDSTWGYFNKTVVTPVSGALNFSLAHPASGGTITLNMPQVRFRKYKDDIKIGDIVMTNLDFEAEMQLSSQQSVTGTVINSAYLPY